MYLAKNSENYYQNGYLNRCKSRGREITRAKPSTTKNKSDQVSSALTNENSYFLSANWLAPAYFLE